MRRCLVVKQFKFSSAHHLPNHSGKCREHHGHNYLLEVGVRGPIKAVKPLGHSSEGMVVDFADLKLIVNDYIITNVDHKDLNRVLMDIPVTTAEEMAWRFFEILEGALLGEPDECWNHLELAFVRLWETDSGYAEVTREDFGQSLVGE